MSCGRTKAEALVTEVIGPKFLNEVLCELKMTFDQKPSYFGVCCDASNRRNRKLFPVVLTYFTPNGRKTALVDFYEDAYENAASIFDRLQSSLFNNGLDIRNVSCYSADNASVNFGKNSSVYTRFKAESCRIVKANCYAICLHNATRFSFEQIGVDIESLVLRVYGHFSVSAKRRAKLQEFCNFVDCEFSEILRHVSTRWLSLRPAIERLLKIYPAIVSYFRSLRDCPRAIRDLMRLDKVTTFLMNMK